MNEMTPEVIFGTYTSWKYDKDTCGASFIVKKEDLRSLVHASEKSLE